MKVVFMGTPEIATYALRAIIDLQCNLLVISQPDRPVGRKQVIVATPVKELANNNKLKILQPEKVSECLEQIKEFNPDIIITCAFGQFVPESILLIPKFGCVNIHASLLPKYRGGAPIHWAVIKGEKKTGLTFMYMIKKMDAGNIIFKKEISVDSTDTTGDVYNKLCPLVYQSLYDNFFELVKSNVKSTVQDEQMVTFGLNIKREDELIDFNDTSINVYNKIRGLLPKPVGYFKYNNLEIKILNASIEQKSSMAKTIIDASKDGLIIATKDYAIKITKLQIAGKKIQDTKEINNIDKIFIKGTKVD